MALARFQSTRVLPCLLSSIPPDPRPALCPLRPRGLRRPHVLPGYSTRPTTPRFNHSLPPPRHGTRCLFRAFRLVAALIRPDTRLYSAIQTLGHSCIGGFVWISSSRSTVKGCDLGSSLGHAHPHGGACTSSASFNGCRGKHFPRARRRCSCPPCMCWPCACCALTYV